MTMKVFSFDAMWYSSSAYQILPNRDSPVPHFDESLKLSTSEFEVLEFVLEVFVFVLATFAFLFSFRLETFTLLLLLELMLANAMIITTMPTPITPTAARPPSIHQTALDFFCG